jgi:hypothetical protein
MISYAFIIICLLLCSCGGNLSFVDHKVLYKNLNGELSCYENVCCWPYKEKLMICTETTDVEAGSIIIKYKN